MIAGLVNFWTRVFMLPKEVINLVQRLCRGYIWGGTHNSHKIHAVAWDDFCLPLEEGGMWMKQVHVWNKVGDYATNLGYCKQQGYSVGEMDAS